MKGGSNPPSGKLAQMYSLLFSSRCSISKDITELIKKNTKAFQTRERGPLTL